MFAHNFNHFTGKKSTKNKSKRHKKNNKAKRTHKNKYPKGESK